MGKRIKGLIFDLDGVIVDTTSFHFSSWIDLASELGFSIPDSLDEELKGLSRVESLSRVLKYRDQETPEKDWPALADRKNELYLDNISHLGHGDTLPGVIPFLEDAKRLGLLLAVGSGSKNARPILERLGITHLFETVCDGTDTQRSKPDPQVFDMACEQLGIKPEEAIVFEDAASGVEAALSCGTKVIAIGDENTLGMAHLVIPSLENTTAANLIETLDAEK